MNNGNMFGGMGGGSGGMGGGNGGMGVNANMFGNGPVPRGGVCPMLQGVTDMQAFKTSCMMLMQVCTFSYDICRLEIILLHRYFVRRSVIYWSVPFP